MTSQALECQRIYSWIQRVFVHDVRRPTYPADRWAEQFCLKRFRDFGLENARAGKGKGYH